MAELILRLRSATHRGPGARFGDAWWILTVGASAALVVGWSLTVSVQAACAFVLVIVIVAFHQYDRRLGIGAMFAFWFLAPLLRRVLALMTGTIENDPLSLAPFLATGAIAVLELGAHLPPRIRVVLLMAGAGFAVGLPLGFVAGPRAAVYAFVAYVAGLSGLALGLAEGPLLRDSMLRRMLLFGMPAIAAYAIAQRYAPLPAWDEAWLNAVDFDSIGSGRDDKVRVFASLNSPGTLAGLLALSLLCYLTITRHHILALAGAGMLTVAISLTFVRSAWYALIVAALAHVIASRGRSARVILGAAAVTVAAALAMSPVSAAARDVVNRFETITQLGTDRSANDRSTSFSQLLPRALEAPAGHGLGSAGEPSKLSGESSLRFPDNGYLSLLYQVGPGGFLLVVASLGFILVAAWKGARARGPGQELRLLLFSMLIFLATLLAFGDLFYGSLGVILWFIGGQVLAYDWRRRAAPA
ncbi:MAG: O-antigen ligase family protein [Actinomycetota bacterium]|nr:O-antigen ligase family protein [Actinomycetota bacterium]